jgi:hypothetical protein
MAKFQRQPNTGALFGNYKRNPADPEMRGKGLLEVDLGDPIDITIEAFFRRDQVGDEIVNLTFNIGGEEIGSGVLCWNPAKESDQDRRPHMVGFGDFSFTDSNKSVQLEILAWISDSNDRFSLRFKHRNSLSLRERFGHQSRGRYANGGNPVDDDDSADNPNDAADRNTHFFDSDSDDSDDE